MYVKNANYQNKLDAVVIQNGRQAALLYKCCENVLPILFKMLVVDISNIAHQRKLESV